MNSNILDWTKEFDAAITVCDRNGYITEMNEKACETFAADGGKELIGHNLKDCHKPESWVKIQEIMHSGNPNIYTIEKNGLKKMIIQQPWYQDGEVAGLVELSIVLPENMPHHVR
jgi:sensor histidine kinase regulating citrate/malate metabolism